MPKFKNAKIRTKLLSQIFIVLLLIIFLFYSLATYTESRFMNAKVEEEIKHMHGMFNNFRERDALMLSSVLDVFSQNQEFKKIFLERDREKLYKHGYPLFEELKNKYGITHFYFHLPDGHNFLRLHNRTIYGDKIKRTTFEQAKGKNKVGAGVELGKTAYALRVVKPYYYNHELIGYVELGEEIDHFLDNLQKQRDDGSRFAIVANKEYLSSENWKFIREDAGLDNNWDDMESHVVLNELSASQEVRDCFNEKNEKMEYQIKNEQNN